MERSDVAGHQGSGECAHEGHSEGMHVFLRHLVSNASERGCFGANNPQPGCRVPYRLRLVKRDKAPGGDGGNSENYPLGVSAGMPPVSASSSARRSAWIMCTGGPAPTSGRIGSYYQPKPEALLPLYSHFRVSSSVHPGTAKPLGTITRWLGRM